jgi:hypothetical protein
MAQGLAVVDGEGLAPQAQPLPPFQQRFDLVFVLRLDLLGGHDATVLIAEDQHTPVLATSWTVPVKVPLGDGLPAVELLDDGLRTGHVLSHHLDPAVHRGLPNAPMEEGLQQPGRPATAPPPR